ncbi:MAG: hypothetical protein E5V49_11255 [Mesorhizobium sp.]|nr:hypothetical protein EN848_02110 [bacterium M00.F.Ca.ET.205.01.1.1]TGU54642.1 hypothetical protein EN795_06525 [bacterium M00.F.Ca.ET.152.01.1.1]TGV38581.1 hypothetical protein EN829_006555 [Mesorhizobium sp. M00.F.Ca.ET.186.01.1.1]TGZ44214.1 hypothetical protein EN805_06530 [bacterium M00.F.Ca.ET.162.01.1.1]TJW32668.1 MAG: hypothetical protein E5V49_11255 [Mesorhizobium sp.]
MTAFLRNTLLAAVAVSAMSGSALADQTAKTCAYTNLNDLWTGRCCNVGESNCLGGGNNGHDHGNKGGRDPNGGSTAGGPAGKY